MAKQNQLELSNEAKLKMNSVIQHFHNCLNHWEEVRRDTNNSISASDFLAGYFDAISAYEDMVQNGTPNERAKFIVLTSMKNAILKATAELVNGESRVVTDIRTKSEEIN